jgi:hypothetical protein
LDQCATLRFIGHIGWYRYGFAPTLLALQNQGIEALNLARSKS